MHKYLLIGIVAILLIAGGWWYFNRSSTSAGIVSATPTTGAAPLAVNFTVNATDSSKASGIYYTIVFGDDKAAGFERTSNPTLSHTYASPGRYQATVTKRTQCSSSECLGPSQEIDSFTIEVK